MGLLPWRAAVPAILLAAIGAQASSLQTDVHMPVRLKAFKGMSTTATTTAPGLPRNPTAMFVACSYRLMLYLSFLRHCRTPRHSSTAPACTAAPRWFLLAGVSRGSQRCSASICGHQSRGAQRHRMHSQRRRCSSVPGAGSRPGCLGGSSCSGVSITTAARAQRRQRSRADDSGAARRERLEERAGAVGLSRQVYPSVTLSRWSLRGTDGSSVVCPVLCRRLANNIVSNTGNFPNPDSWVAAMPRVVRSWLRCYLMCMLLYVGTAGLWAYYIYGAFRTQLFRGAHTPAASDMLEQIKVLLPADCLQPLTPLYAAHRSAQCAGTLFSGALKHIHGA